MFDFDGTLSNLVVDRMKACLQADCFDLLKDLCARPDDLVAVISSRKLEDLILRVNLPNAVVIGGSGLEFRVPGGHFLKPSRDAELKLETARERILPSLRQIESTIPGVDVEDKHWSAAVHFRHSITVDRVRVTSALGTLQTSIGTTVYYGPEVAEVQFISKMSKAQALRTLNSMYLSDGGNWQFVYAGDDQNDVEAMRWVKMRGGINIIVGDRIKFPGARRVASPADLAQLVRDLSNSKLPHEGGEI